MLVDLDLKLIKTQAKKLKESLWEIDMKVKQCMCYDIISRMYGFKNWNTFNAFLKKTNQGE